MPRRLDSRAHRIPPRVFRTPEITTRPQAPVIPARPNTPVKPLKPTPTRISTTVRIRGIKVQVISPDGDMSRTNPAFNNIARAAVDIVNGGNPRISSGDLDIDDPEEENLFEADLYYGDGEIASLTVKVLLNHTSRIKAINEIFESVDGETLDSENCSICIQSYTTAAALSDPETAVNTPEKPSTSAIANGFEDSIYTSNDSKDPIIISNEPHHGAVKLKTCGHVFGRRCITQWLKENSTCPMCRRKVLLPTPFRIKMWVYTF